MELKVELKNNRLPTCGFLLTSLFLASALLPTTVSADLLLSKAINESVPQSGTSPIDSVDFKVFLEDQSGSFSPVPVFEETFSESDAGTSLIFSSGPLFDQAFSLLTNGVDDFVTVYVGPLSNTYNESAFFGLTPDLVGHNITSVVANLDTIEITPLGQVMSMHFAQLDFTGSIEVHGLSLPEPGGLLLGLFALIGLVALPPRQRRDS